MARLCSQRPLLVFSLRAGAEVRTKELTYKQGDTELQGFLAWDAASEGKRPGVLVVHEWWGHNQHARNQAIRLAKDGYVGLAVDMYGKGKVTTHPPEAQSFAAEATKDPALVKARLLAALDLLTWIPTVSPRSGTASAAASSSAWRARGSISTRSSASTARSPPSNRRWRAW